MSDSEQEFILSDEENENLTFDQAKRCKLCFGQYKGKRLAQLIRNSKGREYLRYLLTWDKLREDGRANITVCLEEYKTFKQSKKANKSECKVELVAPVEVKPAPGGKIGANKQQKKKE